MNQSTIKDENLKNRDLQLITLLINENHANSNFLTKNELLKRLNDADINTRNNLIRLIINLLTKEGYKRDAIYKKISNITGLAISTLHNIRHLAGRYRNK